MSATSVVGATTLPVAAGAAFSPLADPVVNGLLDFFGFMLKTELDSKLAQLQPTSSDACPTATRYPYDPSTYWVRNPVPALYVWWDGQSRIEPDTLLYDRRIRELRLFYVFDEQVAPDGVVPRAGLMAVADAAIAKASSFGRHPSYAYGTSAIGSLLVYALAEMGMLGWEYIGGTPGAMMAVPIADARQGGGGEGAVVRYFPVLKGTIRVVERIGLEIQDDPADVNQDTAVTVRTNENGDLLDTVTIMDRVIPPYSGQVPPQED